MKQKKKILLVFTLIMAMLSCPLAVFGADSPTISEEEALDNHSSISVSIPENTAEEYTVTYYANTGTGFYQESHMYPAYPYTVINAKTAGISKEDFAFGTWNTKPDGSGETYEAGDRIDLTSNEWVDSDNNLRLYAIWSYGGQVRYSVTYSSNLGGQGSYYQGGIVPGGKHYIIDPEAEGFYKDFYEFDGWYADPTDKSTRYEIGQEVELFANMVIYAHWKLKVETVYTVYYLRLDGTSILEHAWPEEPYKVKSGTDLGFDIEYEFGTLYVDYWYHYEDIEANRYYVNTEYVVDQHLVLRPHFNFN